ncbi:hypothetical protein NQZ68_031916 [Dissostichus eleginoides]|nr:hypothetical protein NQZ68_031916 [Dissostichus eleginoides]
MLKKGNTKVVCNERASEAAECAEELAGKQKQIVCIKQRVRWMQHQKAGLQCRITLDLGQTASIYPSGEVPLLLSPESEPVKYSQ